MTVIARILAGIAFGVFFYGGLWLTVKRLASARHPATLAFGSLVLRISVVIAGLLLLGQGRWQNIAAILAGLTGVRIVISRLLACI